MSKIAIIGSGISGLSLAYMLKPFHEIVVYEKNDYIGGHSRTKIIQTSSGEISVDTGFIVFNFENYPHLSALFKSLDVPIKKTSMSFGVSLDEGRFEYSCTDFFHIFAQKRNLFSFRFWKMLFEIKRFQKIWIHYVDTDLTLGDLLDKLGMSDYFIERYLLPLGSSIWSSSCEDMKKFPARTFIHFMSNHGLIQLRPLQWYTVDGGSRIYVEKLTRSFKDQIRLNTPVQSVNRLGDSVEVIDKNGQKENFDEVVLACHSDQALSLLAQPTDKEKEVLSQIKYSLSQIYLHSDERFLPVRKKTWASWVYRGQTKLSKQHQIYVSYWMNRLQNLDVEDTVIVTLNPPFPPLAETVYDTVTLGHPIFNQSAIEAQQKIREIQGCCKTWFVGAWQGYGFHEDGLSSAVQVANQMGIKEPWSF